MNLVVVSDAGGIPEEEILRAVAPGGAAYIRNGGGWKQISKPRAENLDDWTHYLHDPSNNAVARDAAVGPPRHMQWVGSPPWARHHDRMASMNALVVDRGRMYYVFDEGPTAAIMLPPEWKLIARDAFNGTVLWKKELLSWHPHLWPMKSGFAQLPRRIVAGAGKVYAPLGLGQPLVCMDGASGEVLRSYEGSGTVEEVILSEGVLFVLVNPAPPVHDDFKPAVKRKMWDAMRRAAGGWPWDEKKRDLTAFEAQTGKVLWERECRVSPLTLAADKARLYYHDGRVVVCLDRANGRERWKSGQLGTGFPKKHFTGGTKATEKWRPKGVSSAFVPASFGATLVVHGDTVLFAGGDDVLTGLSADSGKKLWTAEMLPSGSPYDSVGLLREGYRAYPVKLETEPECHVYDHGFSESVVYLCPAEQCGLLSYGYEVVGEYGEYGKDWWLACNECKTKVKKIGYEEAVALIEGGHCKFEKED